VLLILTMHLLFACCYRSNWPDASNALVETAEFPAAAQHSAGTAAAARLKKNRQYFEFMDFSVVAQLLHLSLQRHVACAMCRCRSSFMSSTVANHPLKITVVSGSINRPSRTHALLVAITEQLSQLLAAEFRFIELSELAPALGASLNRDNLQPAVRSAIADIENADALIVATPVYRGAYTGLLKHLFDLVHHESLIDTPVLVAASGGSQRHALVIEHQLRPLFGFFQAATLPFGIYADESHFTDFRISDAALNERIARVAVRAVPFFVRQTTLQRAAHDDSPALAKTASA